MIFRLKIASGPRAGQALALSKPTTLISGQAEADVELKELGEKAKFEIHYDEQSQTLALHNHGQTELWLNNRPSDASPLALNSGDELRLGTLRLVVQAPGLRPASVLAQVPQRKPISPWTWLLVAAIAGSAIAGMAAFILTRLN
jgi:hypothetical protein